ncbi:MAG: putative CAAX amino terminal protease self-immunity [Promethearchaeota archaeon]|nr:MAG: putative CAAX amino terminal protease self-immunity [Candidatus Lokiarchaeota archaeon]
MSDNNSKTNSEVDNDKWKFCPTCGERLPPDSDNITYCPSCGFSIKNFKERGTITHAHDKFIDFTEVKLTEKELSDNTKKPLWSTSSSIFLPLFAFATMEFIVVVIFFILVFIFPEILLLEELIDNTLFLIVFSLFEFIFIFIPLIAVGKYLQTPSIRNRLGILGLPIDQTKLGKLKEIFLGFGFSVIAVFLVNLVSFFLEFILSFFFDLEVVFNSQNPSSEIDNYIFSANLFEIVLLVLIMILVVGPSEEIAFRGYTQKGLIRNLGNTSGILITALIFTAIHLLTLILIAFASPISFFVQFILMFFPYFALSLLLGMLFHYRDENLIAPIVLHGVYNSLTVILGYIFYNGTIEDLNVFFLIIILLMVISFFSYYILEYIEKNNKWK